MRITAQTPHAETPHVQNDIYCVEWDVKLYAIMNLLCAVWDWYLTMLTIIQHYVL